MTPGRSTLIIFSNRHFRFVGIIQYSCFVLNRCVFLHPFRSLTSQTSRINFGQLFILSYPAEDT